MGNTQKKSHISQSFIKEQTSPFMVRLLKKVDVFSFIPVPKDQPVSTKQSLIGTLIFFVIFLVYIIYDFVAFVMYNPLISQVYYQKLDDQNYQLPRFGLSFMYSNYLNQTNLYNEYLSYQITQQMKDKGIKVKENIPIYVYQYQNQTVSQYDISENENQYKRKFQNNLRFHSDMHKFSFLNQKLQEDYFYTKWLDEQTKKFYHIFRFPKKKTFAKGLLYSTNQATYAKASISLCNLNNTPQLCANFDEMKLFLSGGRIFLFVQELPIDNPLQSDNQNDNKFLIYNFFLTPLVYKRVTFNMQVQKTQVFPDYFWRWSTEIYTKVKVNSILQQTSDVTANFVNETSLDLLGITFQLAPQIMHVRIQSLTLIDKLSMWGALWGVLFSIFALIFLSYNRQKYYRKNPDWNNFKKTLNKQQEQSWQSIKKNQVDYENVRSNFN